MPGVHGWRITYAVIVLISFITVGRMVQPKPAIHTSRLRGVLALVGALLDIVCPIFGLWLAPLATTTTGEDLSLDSWTTALGKLNDILAEQYAFADWKQIEWDSHSEYAPRIAAAEEAKDPEA